MKYVCGHGCEVEVGMSKPHPGICRAVGVGSVASAASKEEHHD